MAKKAAMKITITTIITIVVVESRNIVPQCLHRFDLELSFFPQFRQVICFMLATQHSIAQFGEFCFIS